MKKVVNGIAVLALVITFAACESQESTPDSELVKKEQENAEVVMKADLVERDAEEAIAEIAGDEAVEEVQAEVAVQPQRGFVGRLMVRAGGIVKSFYVRLGALFGSGESGTIGLDAADAQEIQNMAEGDEETQATLIVNVDGHPVAYDVNNAEIQVEG